MSTVEVLTTNDQIERLTPAWDELARAAGSQPFGLPAVARAWHRHFGNGTLEVLAARDRGGDLRALLPVQRRSKAGLTILEPVGQGMGAVAEAVARPGDASYVARIWERLADDAEILFATDLRLDGRGVDDLLDNAAIDWLATLSDGCPVLELDGFEDAEDYLSRPERAGLRKKIHKARRGLAGSDFRFQAVTEPDQVAHTLERLTPLYDRAEAANPRLHLGAEPNRAFFVEMLTGLAERGGLCLLVAELDGDPVAFDIHVVAGAVASTILGRFDPDAAAHSPGHLLTAAGIDWAIGAGVDTIDLQLGTDLYKRRWATRTYRTVEIVVAPSSRVAAVRRRLRIRELARRAAVGLADRRRS